MLLNSNLKRDRTRSFPGSFFASSPDAFDHTPGPNPPSGTRPTSSRSASDPSVFCSNDGGGRGHGGCRWATANERVGKVRFGVWIHLSPRVRVQRTPLLYVRCKYPLSTYAINGYHWTVGTTEYTNIHAVRGECDFGDGNSDSHYRPPEQHTSA